MNVKASWSVRRAADPKKIYGEVLVLFENEPPVIIRSRTQSASAMGYVFIRRDAKLMVRSLEGRM